MNSDAIKKTPMQIQYEKLKSAHMDCILFFRLGDFYEMFDKDAEIASEILGIVLTARKNKSGSHKMCGIPFHSSENYINKLVEHGHKVAVAEQVSDPSQKGIVERKVVNIITPATNLSVKQNENSSTIMSLIPAQGGWKFLIADISTLRLVKGEIWNLSEFDEVCQHHNVSELITLEEIENFDSGIGSYVKENSILTKQIAKSDLERVLDSELTSLELEKSDEKLFAKIKHYIQMHLGQFVRSFQKCQDFRSQKSFRLSYKTAVNLELFANFDGASKNSLFRHINFCKTSMGANKLMHHLLCPLSCADSINERLSLLAKFGEAEVRHDAGELLATIKNLPRLVARIETNKATPADMINLLVSLRSAVELSENAKICDVFGVKKFRSDLSELFTKLETLIDTEPKIVLNKGYIFKEDTTEELKELRSILENSHGLISNMLEDEKQATGIANMKIKYNKVFGYFIEVSKGKTDQVPEHYIRRQTLTNAERYTTTELQEFEQKVMSAESNLVELESQMFMELLDGAKDFLRKVVELSDFVATVDVIYSHNECIERMEFCKPEMTVSKDFEVQEGFHPVIKNLLNYGEFISNNLDLSGCAFKVLTGPNMGGKSTFLRQNAIILLLASIGSYVPAKSAKLGVCDGIYTRVGASDNLSKGQSTFMVEMEETAEILKKATDKSFVIIDELGRGTSSLDGIAIASSVCKFINNEVKSRTLFATHFFELAALVEDTPEAGNLCVSVSTDTHGKPVFLRKIIDGSIDRSYGVEVAAMAGIPESILSDSRDYIASSEGLKDKQNVSTTIAIKSYSQDSPKTRSQRSLFSDSETQKAVLNHKTRNDENTAIYKKLQKLDLNSMTPIEAMVELHELKKLSQKKSKN